MLLTRIQKIIDETVEKINNSSDITSDNSKDIQSIILDAKSRISQIKLEDSTELHSMSHRSISTRVLRVPPIHVPPVDLPVHIPTPEEIREALEKAARDKLTKEINNAFDEVRNSVPNPSDEAKKMLNQLEELKKQIKDFFDVKGLLEKAIKEAEGLCEEYLKSKLIPIEQAIPVKSIPEVKLTLNENSIKCDVVVYFVETNYTGNKPQEDFLTKISAFIEQIITNLSVPTVLVNTTLGNIEDRIKNEIESQKQALIEGMLAALFGDYLMVFNKFREIAGI
ncbi:hypothetical protein ABE099_05125 [Paenibacillus turicensis]|uniref:hypothetical protein n=1 Tax=Paenibacillus turicensis TaxID=160487 RepID=UPI003D2DE739